MLVAGTEPYAKPGIPMVAVAAPDSTPPCTIPISDEGGFWAEEWDASSGSLASKIEHVSLRPMQKGVYTRTSPSSKPYEER